LYASPNIVRVIKSRGMRLAGQVACVEEMRNASEVWLGNLEGRDHSEDMDVWEDYVRMDLEEMGWEGVDWMHLAQDRDQWQAVVNMVMKLWVPV
jgi:hypothetical protein